MDNQVQNAQSIAATCPHDILQLIFELFVLSNNYKCRFLRRALNLSHVCREWRLVAIDTPRIWSRIGIDLDKYQSTLVKDYLEEIIERVRSFPVEVAIEGISEENKGDNLYQLELYRFSKIQKISLCSKDWNPVDELMLGNPGAFERCHPEEWRLQMLDWYIDPDGETWSCDDLFRRFRSLHKLSLNGQTPVLFDTPNCIDQVTSLSLCEMSIDLETIFRKFPRLEELLLDSIALNYYIIYPSMVTLESLKTLRVEDNNGGNYYMLKDWLEHLACPVLKRLSIDQSLAATMEFLSRTPSVTYLDIARLDTLHSLADVAPQLEHLIINGHRDRSFPCDIGDPTNPIFPHLHILEIQDSFKSLDIEWFERLVCMRCLPTRHHRCNRPDTVMRLERLEFWILRSRDTGLLEAPWMVSDLYDEAEKMTFPHDEYPYLTVARLWWRD